MRKPVFILIALGTLLVLSCRKKSQAELSAAQSPLLARWYFAGLDRIAADTNSAKLLEISALPESRSFREFALGQLGGAFERLILSRGNATNEDRGPRHRLLLEEFLAAESHFEAREQGGGGAEWVLCFRPRAKLAWRTNFAELVRATKPASVSETNTGPFTGSQAMLAGGMTVRWGEAGNWLVLYRGKDAGQLFGETLDRLRAAGRPGKAGGDAWWEGELDAAWAARAAGLPDWFQGPPGQWPERLWWTVHARGDSVRTQMKLEYARRLALKLTPWQIPTNTIRDDPMISFVAVQPVESWIEKIWWVKRLKLESVPDQLFAWALADVPFASYAAAPVRDVTNTIRQAAKVLPELLSPKDEGRAIGNVVWDPSRTEVIWTGLPVLVPFLRPENEPAGQFLLGGAFPTAPSTNPPPPELISQLRGRTNLLYYHWEITQARLVQWRTMAPLIDIIVMNLTGGTPESRRLSPGPGGQKWLEALGKHLGETVTEITQSGPSELSVVRKSHAGMTGLELLLLAWWLEDPKFHWPGQ